MGCSKKFDRLLDSHICVLRGPISGLLFTMEGFYKTGECPASEKLAAVAGFAEVREELRIHLSTCNFCAWELDLYRRYPPTYETVEAPEIPEPLLELANSLLHKRRDLTELYRLAGGFD